MKTIAHLVVFRVFLGFLMVIFLSGCSEPDMYDSQGKGVTLKDDKGRWMAVNVWASWCGSCRQEVPELNALMAKGEVRVVGYDFDNSRDEELKQKIKWMGIDFPVLTKSPLAILGQEVPRMLPATMIVSSDGVYQETIYGAHTRASMEKRIRELKKKARK